MCGILCVGTPQFSVFIRFLLGSRMRERPVALPQIDTLGQQHVSTARCAQALVHFCSVGFRRKHPICAGRQ